MIIDGTGLKVYGKDEWHQEKHGVTARRSWRRLRLAVNEKHQIVACELNGQIRGRSNGCTGFAKAKPLRLTAVLCCCPLTFFFQGGNIMTTLFSSGLIGRGVYKNQLPSVSQLVFRSHLSNFTFGSSCIVARNQKSSAFHQHLNKGVMSSMFVQHKRPTQMSLISRSTIQIQPCDDHDGEQLVSGGDISIKFTGDTNTFSGDYIAVIQAASSFIFSIKGAMDESKRHGELLEAINRVESNLLEEMRQLRLQELEGQVRGLLNEFHSFTRFSPNKLENFRATANMLEGEHAILMRDQGLNFSDPLAKGYCMVILLRQAALVKNNEKNSEWALIQAKNRLIPVRDSLLNTVKCMRYYDDDHGGYRYWCRSTYTGSGFRELKAPNPTAGLWSTSYNTIVKALESIDQHF